MMDVSMDEDIGGLVVGQESNVTNTHASRA